MRKLIGLVTLPDRAAKHFIALLFYCACAFSGLCCSSSMASEDYAMLGIVGFNYTNRHISDYTINGAGGGIVNLSSSTSGGSGITCCVRFPRRQIQSLEVKVRWQRDGCKYLQRSMFTSAVAEMRHFYYKEANIIVALEGIHDPKFIETHFYQDGTVKIKLTESISSPVVVLDGNRPDLSNFPECTNGKNPEE